MRVTGKAAKLLALFSVLSCASNSIARLPDWMSTAGIGRGQTLAGDPVDIRWGFTIIKETFATIPGSMPISLSWVYRGKDDSNGPMGRGTWLSTDYYTVPIIPAGSSVPTSITLIAPGNYRYSFPYSYTDSLNRRHYVDGRDPQWAGTNIVVDDPTHMAYSGSSQIPCYLEIKGSGRLVFNASGELTRIEDRFGNQNQILRNSNGFTTAVLGSSGSVYLTYDGPVGKLSAVQLMGTSQSTQGRFWTIAYDSATGQFGKITDPGGGVTQYQWSNYYASSTGSGSGTVGNGNTGTGAGSGSGSGSGIPDGPGGWLSVPIPMPTPDPSTLTPLTPPAYAGPAPDANPIPIPLTLPVSDSDPPVTGLSTGVVVNLPFYPVADPGWAPIYYPAESAWKIMFIGDASALSTDAPTTIGNSGAGDPAPQAITGPSQELTPLLVPSSETLLPLWDGYSRGGPKLSSSLTPFTSSPTPFTSLYQGQTFFGFAGYFTTVYSNTPVNLRVGYYNTTANGSTFTPQAADWSYYVDPSDLYSRDSYGYFNGAYGLDQLFSFNSASFTGVISSLAAQRDGTTFSVKAVSNLNPSHIATAYIRVITGSGGGGGGGGGGGDTGVYSPLPVLIRIIDRSNRVRVQNYYDTLGRVSKQVLADGGIWQFQYNTNSTVVKDPNNNKTTYNYSIDGIGYDITGVTNALGELTTFTRDGSNRVISATDFRGRSVSCTYDTYGNVKTLTRPTLAGTLTDTIQYDPTWNLPISYTDSRGRVTTSHLNTLGQVDYVISPPSPQNPQGMKTEFEYNSYGLLTTVKRTFVPADAPSTTRTIQSKVVYFYNGLVNYTEDTVGNRTYFSYDNAARLIAVRYPNDSAVRYAYNNMDQVVQVGFTTNYLSPSSTTMASYIYDVEGRLAYFTNARGKSWSYTYDAMDRPKTARDPLLSLSQAEYDVNGNTTRTVDPMGHESRFIYDIGKGDRPLKERYYQYAPLNPNVADVEVNYSYDNLTHLLSSVTNSGSSAQKITGGTTNYTYDVLDRLTAEVGPQGYSTVNYDNYGLVTSTSKNGVQSESYTYDNWDRVSAVTNTRVLASGQDTKTISYSYDTLGRPTGYSTSGASYGVTYADNGFVTSTSTSAGSMSMTNSYQYSWQGQILSDTWVKRRSGQVLQSWTDTYSYDFLGQLTGANVLGTVFGYTYDLAGNRLTETKDGLTKNFGYDDANRLTGVSVGSQFANTLSYDGNGNLTNISYAGGMGGVVANLSLSWNMFGQLASSTHQNGSVNTLGYDMFGERNAKNGSTLVSFGGNRGGDLTVGLDSFVQTESGAKVIQNHRGDLSALSSADGTGAGRVYDPYGNLLNAWTAGTGVAPTSEYGFTGAEELGNGQTTDLVYLRARYYHPGLGRFISQDPIGFAGGTNLYAYCGNDPINYTDPLGLSRVTIFGTGFEFNLQSVGDGLATSAAALGAALDDMLTPSPDKALASLAMGNPQIALLYPVLAPSMPHWSLYDGGAYKCMDGFSASKGSWNVAIIAATMAKGLANAGMCAGRAARLFPGANPVCFVAGTPVLMADGSSKAIENVKAGDLVLSKDEKTGEIVKRKVVETKVRTADATLVVEVAGGGRVEATAEHPFYVEGKGWTPAGQLAIENAIVTRTGPSVKVVKIEKKEKSVTVYNFEVADTHSYFVGGTTNWLWAHNNCTITPEIRSEIAVVLRRINRGAPHPYRQDGTIFQNRLVTGRTTPELPSQPLGYYKEYTVPTAGASNRGARRIVTGTNGEIYFTGDHYNTFIRLR